MTQQFHFSEDTFEPQRRMLTATSFIMAKMGQAKHSSKEEWFNKAHNTSWEAVQEIQNSISIIKFSVSICTLHDLIRTNLL